MKFVIWLRTCPISHAFFSHFLEESSYLLSSQTTLTSSAISVSTITLWHSIYSSSSLVMSLAKEKRKAHLRSKTKVRFHDIWKRVFFFLLFPTVALCGGLKKRFSAHTFPIQTNEQAFSKSEEGANNCNKIERKYA